MTKNKQDNWLDEADIPLPVEKFRRNRPREFDSRSGGKAKRDTNKRPKDD